MYKTNKVSSTSSTTRSTVINSSPKIGDSNKFINLAILLVSFVLISSIALKSHKNQLSRKISKAENKN